MELHEAIRRRAMVRSFADQPVDPDDVARILQAALRAPTAGNTRGTAWVVLDRPEQTAAYFEATTDAAWRARHQVWADNLERAPVVLLAYTSPDAYVARYAEEDKAAARSGSRRGRVAHPLLDRRRGLRRHDRPAGGGRRRPRRLRARRLPGRGGTGRQSRRAGRVAPVLRRAARPPRRQRASVLVPGPDRTGLAETGSTRDGGDDATARTPWTTRVPGPSCQRAIAHSRSDRRFR